MNENLHRELIRCGINVVDPPEVKGELNGFTFNFGRGYWIVQGRVPIDVARELYADPVGKTDIRVGGNCCCPSPDEHGTDWFTPDGKQIWPTYQKAEIEKLTMPSFVKHWEKEKDKVVFSDDKSIGSGYVTLYHIDSELGLYIFANAIKKYGVRNPAGA